MVPVGEKSELSFLRGFLHCSDAGAGAVCNEPERRRLAWWWAKKFCELPIMQLGLSSYVMNIGP